MLIKKAKQFRVEWKPINERLIYARFTTNLNISVTVVLVFSSTNERFEGTKESFMEQVQEDNNNIPNYNVDIHRI